MELLAAVALAMPSPARGADGSVVEHGRYLVENVAMCGECHSQNGIAFQTSAKISAAIAVLVFTK